MGCLDFKTELDEACTRLFCGVKAAHRTLETESKSARHFTGELSLPAHPSKNSVSVLLQVLIVVLHLFLSPLAAQA